MMRISEKICPDDETLLTFIEGKSDLEMVNRVLTHLQNCSQCKASLSFVCSAIVLAKRNELPVLSPWDRLKCKDAIQKKLSEFPRKKLSILWEDVVAKFIHCSDTQTVPDVIAAGASNRKLVFCSLQPKNSDTYWCACIEMPEELSGTAVIRVEIKETKQRLVSKGILSFCGISIPITNGKGEFALTSFQKNHETGGIIFTWEDGRSSEGIPVLGSIR